MLGAPKARYSTGIFCCHLVAGLGFMFLLAAPSAVWAEPGPSPWAAIEDGRGITLVPVLACRTPQVLNNITSSAPENREVFVRLFVSQGECTKLPQYTPFTPISRTSEAMHIRTATLGRVWVSQTARVPGFAEMVIRGRLRPDSREHAPSFGLTTDEREAVGVELAKKKTVRGPRSSIGLGGRAFDRVQLTSWTGVLGGSKSGHTLSDHKGLDRCARFNVRYDGSGSRLVSPSSFVARFADGEERRGMKLLGSIRLSRGQAGTGVVCFGGNFMTEIVTLRIR